MEMKGSVTIFPYMIEFSCDGSFILQGSARQKCQANASEVKRPHFAEIVMDVFDCSFMKLSLLMKHTPLSQQLRLLYCYL